MRRLLGTALLLALFSAAMWFAWLGWDHQYYEVDGVAQGPYRAWQVVGCGASVVAAAVLAYVRVRTAVSAGVLAVAAAVGFALPWSWDASSDETGMWAVGLFLLVIGGSIGLGLLLTDPPGHGRGPLPVVRAGRLRRADGGRRTRLRAAGGRAAHRYGVGVLPLMVAAAPPRRGMKVRRRSRPGRAARRR